MSSSWSTSNGPPACSAGARAALAVRSGARARGRRRGRRRGAGAVPRGPPRRSGPTTSGPGSTTWWSAPCSWPARPPPRSVTGRGRWPPRRRPPSGRPCTRPRTGPSWRPTRPRATGPRRCGPTSGRGACWPTSSASIPSAETEAAYLALLGPAPPPRPATHDGPRRRAPCAAGRPPAGAGARSSGGRPSSACWPRPGTQASAGARHVVVVTGEAGIGKSRLAAEAALRVAPRRRAGPVRPVRPGGDRPLPADRRGARRGGGDDPGRRAAAASAPRPPPSSPPSCPPSAGRTRPPRTPTGPGSSPP